jgi:DNA polymerase III subunit delta
MSVPASSALEKINRGIIAPGYILAGTEVYWRDRLFAVLREKLEISDGTMGISEFDLRQDSISTAWDAAQTTSLLAPRQLIIVRNAQMLLARRGRDSDDDNDEGESRSASNKLSGEIGRYFKNPNPASTLLLEMTDLDLDPDDWREQQKAQSRLQAIEGVCEVVLLLRPRMEEAVAMARRMAAERGQKITLEAAERLVAAMGLNLGAIEMELEKLCLFSPEKGEIDEALLNEVGTDLAGESGMGLTEAIGARNLSAALQALDDAVGRGKYPPLLISELARYLRQLIILREKKVRDSRQAGKMLWEAKLWAPQGALPGLVKHAQNYRGPELLRALKLAFDADLALRSGPPDERLVLEKFVVEMIRPVSRL